MSNLYFFIYETSVYSNSKQRSAAKLHENEADHIKKTVNIAIKTNLEKHAIKEHGRPITKNFVYES